MSDRLTELISDLRDKMEACIHNELFNADPLTLPKERIPADSMTEEHGKEIAAAQAIADYVATLTAEVERLRAALARWQQHNDTCGVWNNRGDYPPCTCGLDKAKSLLRAVEEGRGA